MNVKTSLDGKTILFVPAGVFSWRGISSVQGFPYRMKCRLPGVSKTSNEITIINAIFENNNAKILICSISFILMLCSRLFPETDNA